MKHISANFDFLAPHDPQLVRLGALAERYFPDDPNTCLMKLRQFGEVLAQLTAARAGLLRSAEERQVDRLRHLYDERVLPYESETARPTPRPRNEPPIIITRPPVSIKRTGVFVDDETLSVEVDGKFIGTAGNVREGRQMIEDYKRRNKG